MSPQEITRLLARMTDPNKSSEPRDSEQLLAQLIREARAALNPRRRLRATRLYARERGDFSAAMHTVQDAPAGEVRLFVMEVIDLLWGEGSAEANDPRRFDRDKEWEVDTIEAVANALSRRSFYPFPRPNEGEQ